MIPDNETNKIASKLQKGMSFNIIEKALYFFNNAYKI